MQVFFWIITILLTILCSYFFWQRWKSPRTLQKMICHEGFISSLLKEEYFRSLDDYDRKFIDDMYKEDFSSDIASLYQSMLITYKTTVYVCGIILLIILVSSLFIHTYLFILNLFIFMIFSLVGISTSMIETICRDILVLSKMLYLWVDSDPNLCAKWVDEESNMTMFGVLYRRAVLIYNK